MENQNELVQVNQQGKDVTTSVIVAEVFGKEHRSVLRDIENLQCSNHFRVHNFVHTPYVHPQNGQKYHYYEITRDGFSFLAMGYTGAKAAEFKEKFINEFNRRGNALKGMVQLEPEEILMQAIQLQIEQKKRLSAVERDVRELKAQTTTRPNWFTIVGYGTLHNMNISLSIAGSLGKKASKLCKERGIELSSIPDPRFGRVHLYPENILNEVFNEPIM
jgi:Rha family phage regulatory protein